VEALVQLASPFVLSRIARGIRPAAGRRAAAGAGGGQRARRRHRNLMQRARHAQRAGWVLVRGGTAKICDAARSCDDIDRASWTHSPSTMWPRAGRARRALGEESPIPQLLRLANRLATIRDRTLEGAADEQPVP